jgi:hypothetical protein
MAVPSEVADLPAIEARVASTLWSAADRWEHEGTFAVEVAATGTVGDGPTMPVEHDVVVLLAVCRPCGTSAEHSQRYLRKVLTWPSSSSSPPCPSRLGRHPPNR